MIADLIPETWMPYFPLINYYIFAFICIFPIIRIFQRAGLKAIYSLSMFFPFLGMVIVCAILALKKWPSLPMPTQNNKEETA